jgi:hypothetical protein
MTYEVSVPIQAANQSNEGIRVYGKIQLEIDGLGANTVSGPVLFDAHAITSDAEFGHTIVMRHVVENPTPGSSYAFTFVLGARDEADYADIIVAPIANGVQMVASSRLIVERI